MIILPQVYRRLGDAAVAASIKLYRNHNLRRVGRIHRIVNKSP